MRPRTQTFRAAGGVSCDNQARVAFSGECSRFRLVGRPVSVRAFCEGAISLMRT